MAIKISLASQKNVSDAISSLDTSIDDKLARKVDKSVADETYLKKENLDIDLADYAKKEDLADFLKEDDLSDYMKTADADAKYETLEQAAIDHALYAQIAYVDETFCKLTDYTKTEDLADVALSGSYTDLTDTPEIVNELTSDATDKPLAAAQGKVLKEAIQAMAGGIKFKGTIGEGAGTSWDALPTPSEENNGWEYKVITDHADAPACERGDYIISTGTAWVIDPMVDEAFEVTSNKVTSLSSDATDTQYPSAKAVNTALTSKLDASKFVQIGDNSIEDDQIYSGAKVDALVEGKLDADAVDTAVNEGSTHEQIPTSKAVYDAVQTAIDNALTQDDIEQSLSIAEDKVPSSALVNEQLAAKLSTQDVLAEMPSTPTNSTVLGTAALKTALDAKIGSDSIDTAVPDGAEASDSKVMSTKLTLSELAAKLNKATADTYYAAINHTHDEYASISNLDALSLQVSDLEDAVEEKQDKLTLDDTTQLIATLEDGSTVTLNVVTVTA